MISPKTQNPKINPTLAGRFLSDLLGFIIFFTPLAVDKISIIQQPKQHICQHTEAISLD